jgi:hypothetical protein
VGCETALAGNIAEPASPAARVAMPPMKDRRSLDTVTDSRFCGFFPVISASHLKLSNLRLLDVLLSLTDSLFAPTSFYY